MECLNQSLPHASRRLPAFRRLAVSQNRSFSTSRHNQTQQDNTRLKENANETSEKAKKTRETFRDNEKPPFGLNWRKDRDEILARIKANAISKGTAKTNPRNPRISESLPQSPLMRRPYIERETKNRKDRAIKSNSELRHNPWANALASPLRMCPISNTRLPRELLTEWGMVQRPDSEKLWLMPVGLLGKEIKLMEGKAESQEEKNNPNMLTLRMLDRLSLLRQLTPQLAKGEGTKRNRVAKLLPYRWKHPLGPINASKERDLIWREDMPEFVLESMRKVVVGKLLEACSEYHSSVANAIWTEIPVSGYTEPELVEGLKSMKPISNMERGAVLIMIPQKEGDDSTDQSPSSNPEDVKPMLPDFVTLPQTQSRVPVFDLTLLLSEAHIQELRKRDIFQHTALFFRADESVAVNAMVALWKLKGFLKPDAPTPRKYT